MKPFPFGTLAPGTDAPLEMLAACHERIDVHCATLMRLAGYAPLPGADPKAMAAAAARVMRFFDESAPHHHADEEEDLFPALIESVAGSDPVCLRTMIEGFTAEHRTLEAMWQGLRPVLDRIAHGGSAVIPSIDVEAFVRLSKRHVERENGELLPIVSRLLGVDDLARIGSRMRDRRSS